MRSNGGNGLRRVGSLLQIVLAIIAILAILGAGTVALLDLETQADHDADLDLVEERLDNIETMTRCILWGVEPGRCAADS